MSQSEEKPKYGHSIMDMTFGSSALRSMSRSMSRSLGYGFDKGRVYRSRSSCYGFDLGGVLRSRQKVKVIMSWA